MDNTAETQPASWLQRLKEESWEAELLVSAVAIFGSFQLFAIVDWAVYQFVDILHLDQYLLGYLVAFITLFAVSILGSMFVIHFILRSYWVGLVGLNSVFPDYNTEDSVHSPIFTEKMLTKLPRLKDSITQVDELCSVIFACAFCLLMAYGYMALTMTIYLLIFNALVAIVPASIMYIPIYAIVILIVVQGLFSIVANNKKFHDNNTVQNLYFNSTHITYILTQGPLYKNIVQVIMVFVSHFNKKKSLVLLVSAFLLGGLATLAIKFDDTKLKYLAMPDYFQSETRTFAEYYANQNQTMDFLITPEIEADIISVSVVKIFIPILSKEKKGLSNQFCNDDKNLSKFEREERPQINQDQLACFQHYHQVLLNNEEITVDFMRSYHWRTNQSGLIAYLPLDISMVGNNLITIQKRFDTEPMQKWRIPFYYAPTNN